MTTKEFKNKLNRFDLSKEAAGVIKKTSKEYADLNIDQLRHGKTSKDEHIKPEYASRSYAEIKNKMNPMAGAGIPDLKLTGAFYRGFGVTVSGDTVRVRSSDEKQNALVEKYGIDIFGLSSDSLKKYREVLFPELKKVWQNV